MSDERRGTAGDVDAVARRIEALRAGARSPAAPAAGPSVAASPGASTAPDSPPGTSPAGSDSERVAARLRSIGTARAPRRPDLSIGSLVQATRDRAERTQRRLGELIELWEALLPDELLPHTTLGALRGGVLHVHVDSSAVAYELDRLLREGLTAELRRRYRSTLTRVRVTQSTTPPSG